MLVTALTEGFCVAISESCLVGALIKAIAMRPLSPLVANIDIRRNFYNNA